MSSRIARPAYGSRQGSSETGDARVHMAWYAVGLTAHEPEQPADLGDWVVSAAQGGDGPVSDLLFVLLTVAMFVVLALVVRGGERL